jgi:hypothetical protein
MTDVRLTATTTEGEVVPVLSNTKGELLLEAPIAPPEFDGNLDGDLSVTGSGTFTGNVTANKFIGDGSSLTNLPEPPEFDGIFQMDVNVKGRFQAGSSTEDTGAHYIQANRDYTTLIVKNFGDGGALSVEAFGDSYAYSGRNLDNNIFTSFILGDGRAVFAGDVTVGSRSKTWKLVEQGGLCHMVEVTQTLTDQGFSVDVDEYPKLRDVFYELDLIEQALTTVMEKLRLTPPTGWEVWDGSDNT